MWPCLTRSLSPCWGENTHVENDNKSLTPAKQRPDRVPKLWRGPVTQSEENQEGLNEKGFEIGDLQFSLEGVDRHGFELNEKDILGERKDSSSNMESSVGIEFQMRGSCIKFWLHWFEANVECILSHERIGLMSNCENTTLPLQDFSNVCL